MTIAVVFLGVVSILSVGLALALLARVLKGRSMESAQGTYVGHQVSEMRAGLDKVSGAIEELKVDRAARLGELKGWVSTLGAQITALNSTNTALREALANTRVRGHWGERMAEDVLRVVGFVEGINYRKQSTVDESGSRPDFTFLLPRDLKLNMDVKFPLDNYLKCVEAEAPEEVERFRHLFLRDVRARLKEVVTRDYIDPARGTLDYMLVFIPNEQIYQFIHERDSSLMDDALTSKVVLCSPMSLFAILVVIRQAVDNFAVEQSSNQIISELGAFKKQWDLFLGKMQAVGRRIEAAQREYESLITTRRRVLDRHVRRIEAIREQRGLGLPKDSEPEHVELEGFDLEEDPAPLDVPEEEYPESSLERA